MRTKNPEQRQIDVAWSTQRWVPHVVFAPEGIMDRRGTTVEIVPDSLSLLFGKKTAKRRAPAAWGRDGSRPNWR